MRAAVAVLAAGLLGAGTAVVSPASPAGARPSDPGVVSYAVLAKGSVGNIVGGPMRWEATFTDPVQTFRVDNPACNNWADVGLPDVYADPDLASFNGAVTQTSAGDATHLVKQAVGVYANADAADRAFHRVTDRTTGCAGQTTAMHFDDLSTQVWTFTGGPTTATDADWVKQEAGAAPAATSGGAAPAATSGAGTDRRCFTTTRKRENVLLQAKVCQSGNGGPAVNVLAGAMQNTLGQ